MGYFVVWCTSLELLQVIIKDGAFKMPVSEVLNDNESALLVIYEAGPQAAMVKTSKYERVQ